MKVKIFFFLVLLILLFNQSFSQSRITFFTKISYNDYSMAELKNQQDELFNDFVKSNIQAKIIDSYPAHYGFQIGFLFHLKTQPDYQLSVGGSIQHGSTGGRVHYQDYSGELRLDQIAKETGLGFILSYELLSENFNVGFNTTVHLMFSDFSNSFYLKIGEAIQKNDFKFYSTSLGIEPGIVPLWRLWNLRLGLSLSYLIYFPSELEYDNYSEAFLVDRSGNKISIDWSGLQTGIFIGISI